MVTILKNATMLEIDPPAVWHGDLAVKEGMFVSASEGQPQDAQVTVDCTGKVIVPGLVIGHTHLYSALAVGMPPPKKAPRNFVEILEEIWWKIDRALDDEAVYISALVGAARAALCGSTCLIDHHASPTAIDGSLDRVRDALAEVGVRGVLCYEVTDRNDLKGAQQGLDENARFINSVQNSQQWSGRFAGLVGAHASFTLSDTSLELIAEIADATGVGVHIHVAEDPADNEDCRKRTGGKGLVDRLEQFRIMRPGSIFGHCTHLTADEIARVRDAGIWMAHNTRSNMNNSVGYAPIAEMANGKLALGTDGIDGDLFQEMKTAFFKSNDAHTGLGFGAPIEWVAGAARLASGCLETSLGKLKPGCAADLVVLDYDQLTPMSSDNALGHWFFGVQARHVESVMVAGKWIVKNREFTNPRVRQQLERAPAVAARVWEAMHQF